MSIPVADIRKEYKLQTLSETDVAKDPFHQFGKWWEEALAAEIDEVNAMTLATTSLEGKPTARIVLLKGYHENGFIFFTNYESRKGQEIAGNPSVTLLFFWKELERQVRIEGQAEKVSAKESDEYFNSRPAESRLGAWASPQSRVIHNRNWLEDNYRKFEQQFKSKPIQRPPHWGGYIVHPNQIEFWQGRPGRLHDRILYSARGNEWIIERLAP